MTSTRTNCCLLADIGGTNSRLALWNGQHEPARFSSASHFRNDDFAALADVLEHYLQGLRVKPKLGVLAVAAPVTGDNVELLNRDWSFSTTQLQRRLGFDRLAVHNDFFAQALAISTLGPQQQKRIGPLRSDASGTVVVLGPGTGLGIAGLTNADSQVQVITGEGGHMTLAASNRAEAKLIDAARERHGHCSAERLLSGNGLCLLHELMHDTVIDDAASISKAAGAGDQHAIETFEQFFRFLATVASDTALCFGATGGVYIAGGIAHANESLLLQSGFRQRFIDKGRYRQYLDAIPTTLVTADMPALQGLASYAQRWAQCVDET